MPTVSVQEINQDGTPSKKDELMIEVGVGKTIYEEIMPHGHKFPHGCLNGVSGACRMIVLKGDQFLSPPSEKELKTLQIIFKNYQNKFGEEALKGKIIRLSCQSKFIEDDGELEIITAP